MLKAIKQIYKLVDNEISFFAFYFNFFLECF